MSDPPGEEPWTRTSRASAGWLEQLEDNLLTEDNLALLRPPHLRMFGAGDGAWMSSVDRGTSEQGRHAIVLRDYLNVAGSLDPTALEQSRRTQLEQGYERPHAGFAARPGVRGAPRGGDPGRYSNEPVADRIMARISTDA